MRTNSLINCSHAVQCSSDVESNVRRRPCIKHNTPSKSPAGFPKSGSSRYKKSGLSQSYDDLLSAASNESSANSTYGFVRPVLKRSSSTISRKSGLIGKSGYSTGSLCSNKSVKFNLPASQSTALETATGNLDFKNPMDFNNPVSSINPIPTNPLNAMSHAGNGKNPIYYFTAAQGNNPRGNDFPSGNFPAGNFYVCQNLCASCGICPYTSTTQQTAPLPPAFYQQNVQYALIQAQNFFNYQIQQTPTTMSSIEQDSPG